jgi:DNA-binding protein H-NS
MFVQKSELNAMPLDELWTLHEVISAVCFERMRDQKRELEKRLSLLNPSAPIYEPSSPTQSDDDSSARRKYPKVWPRYRNPETSETWSGRGKQPRWVIAAMAAGHSLDDFRITEFGSR